MPIDIPLLESLTVAPPNISAEEVAAIAETQFAIDGTVKLLGGERDKNFLVSNEWGNTLIKVANSSEDNALLEMQCQALEHIERYAPDLPVPRLIRTEQGNAWATVQTVRRESLRVRAFTYLPGIPVDHAPMDSGLMKNLGRIVARLDYALRGFFHPSCGHNIAWDVQRLDQLEDLLEYVVDPDEKSLIEQTINAFKHEIKPKLGGFRAQAIHNDVSFHNTVVDPASPTQVTGVFDFGDMIYGPLIQDLANAAVEIPVGSDDALARSAEIVAGFHEIIPLEDKEISALPGLFAARLAQCLILESWSDTEITWTDDRDHLDGWRSKCVTTLTEIHKTGFDELENLLRAVCGLPESLSGKIEQQPNFEKALANRNQFLGNAGYIAYDNPIHLSRGEGVWLIDHQGKRYLDAYNNVPHAGHCHPRIVSAISRQTAKLNTNTRYVYDIAASYAERLSDTLPKGLDACYFVSSGSEANDLAWRLATTWTSHSGALILEHAYHGVTEAIDAMSPSEGKNGNSHVDHVVEITAPDDYRGPWKRSDPERGRKYAAYADDAIRQLKSRGYAPAAFFMDMIMSSSGIFAPATGYLEAVFHSVHNAGGLCIADEVQSGFGRMGTHMWGFEAGNVIPDIVTFGKPIAGGYPMGLVVTTREIADRFEQTTDFFSTTGGNPVACAAAMAMLEIIEDESLMENARRIGTEIVSGIQALSSRFPIIGDVRGSGLFIGVELVKDRQTLEPASYETQRVMNTLRNNGVLVGMDGIYGNVLKIRPPMIFSTHHVETLLYQLENALSTID
jgi:4-aminobutyrate aminotransferase-like enzyme/Ser/Thr protein kinase RdoA (MazF antagonist)